MAYTPFDQSTRDAYWAQADDQAKRFGISREQGLYNIARANNVSNADVDTLMGFGAGTTDNWLKQRDSANAVTHQNTIAAQQPAPQGNSYTAPSTPAASPATTAVQQPLYAGLSNNSSAADIAGAYREWSGANGGDTTENQRAAESYLQSLGIGSGAINDAYSAYKAPQPLYAGLSNNSNANDIAGAYREWSGANGGDTADNQRAAEGYLSSLGIGRGSILDAYTAYKGQSGASGGATGGGVGGAPSAAQPQPPRGIVESAMSQTLPTAGPTHWSVSPEMTVQGQLRTVMDSNSPLMQQARTQGLQVANERGLLNSSIAESAAMDSMYKAALPIAAADATTYAKSASENAGNATNITNNNTSAATSIANTAANNETSRFNNAANNVTTLAVNNSNNETSRANTAANNATTLATNAANNETSRANAKLQTDAAAALGLEESQYRKLAQGSSSAAQLMTNYQGQLSSLLRDQSFSDAETRQAAIDQLTNSTKAAIQMIGAMAGDLDIAAYMSQLFPAEEGKLAPALPVKW